jgi:hypothetical protein
VQCLGDGHCPSDKTPQCVDHECSACTDNDACADHENKPYCDKGSSSSTKGQCVGCLEDGDCDNPTPQCNANHQCAPCTSNAACVRLDKVCNTRANVETSGQCVQCSGTTEAARCNGKACNQHAGQCTQKDVHSVPSCQSCSADTECSSTARCVVHRFGNMDLGPYCFSIEDEEHPCADADEDRRPFSHSVSTASVDGPPLQFCFPRSATTCSAVLDTSGNPQDCMTNGVRDSSKCGEGIGDGYCNLAGKCTYACDENYDCPSTSIYNTCPMTGAMYCGGP